MLSLSQGLLGLEVDSGFKLGCDGTEVIVDVVAGGKG